MSYKVLPPPLFLGKDHVELVVFSHKCQVEFFRILSEPVSGFWFQGVGKNFNYKLNVFKGYRTELPRWSSGWESTCQCRGHGFNPWSGRIPHATRQPSPCTTTMSLHAVTTDARAPKAVLWNKRRPHLLQLEKACTPQWRPGLAKSKQTVKRLQDHSGHLFLPDWVLKGILSFRKNISFISSNC